MKDIIACFINIVFTKEMKYFTNYKPDAAIYGEESVMKDYVTLSHDPISNLPASFTICSSLYLEKINGNIHIFQMYNENGEHWFNIIISDQLLRNIIRTERINIYYQTGKEKN